MRVFHKVTDIPADVQTSAVAVGNFDGVHLGHASLLEHMLSYARQSGAIPTVLTFFPHPVEVLKPSIKLERLTTTSEKLAIFESMGVELVLVEKFDRDLANLSPSEFFDRFLRHGLRASSIHVGFDFNFGKSRSGNLEVLGQLAQTNGIRLQIEPAYSLLAEGGQVKVSSSGIRQLVREGKVDEAARWLGRPYSIGGPVAAGDQRGRQLGFPTANLRCPADKVLPKNGVYFTRAVWQKQTFRSVANVGTRPTFHEHGGTTLEVHLLDFNAKLYDEFLQVEFLGRIRDEKKFASIDALKAQIAEDVAAARISEIF